MEKTEPKELKETPKKVIKAVKLDPEKVAFLQRAHDLKVAKFLAGGKF